MKKFLLVLIIFVFIFSLFGCSKNDDISKISKNLTTYDIDLELNPQTKSVNAKQNVKYINSTNTILKTLKFHLYPQFFEEGATEYIVPSTKLNNAYPNGMSYAKFNIDRVKVEDVEKQVVYEGEFDGVLCVELNSSLMPNEQTKLQNSM